MAISEADSYNVRALLMLQNSKPESLHSLRSLLIEALASKYAGKRQTKPIPPIGIGYAEPKFKIDDKKEKPKSPPPDSPESQITVSSESDSNSDSLEIFARPTGSCSICKGENKSNGQLVECAECHSMYHEECHFPAITEDLSDPRVVWYCRNCKKSFNKPKVSAVKKESSKKNQPTTSFTKPFGSKSKPSSSSSSSQSKSHMPNINIISADKRLAIMKKKAASKKDKRSTAK